MGSPMGGQVAGLTAGWRLLGTVYVPARCRCPDRNARPPVQWSEARGADETMARITAERLVEHLERSGYLVMHKPPLGQHGAAGNLAGWIEKATKSDRGG
jgi:hypothetical protein